MIDEALERSLLAAASVPVLLIASDYDGTLAELVDDPAEAHPHGSAIASLRSLASLRDTHVALVSGRSIRDLVALSGLAHDAVLVGSHGAEFADGVVEGLDDAAHATLGHVGGALDAIAASVPGARVEHKPASVTFHTREVTADEAAAAVAAVLAVAAERPGIRVKHGSDVVELAVVAADKGTALRRLRDDVAADVVVFVGDDITDEDAFAVLGDRDVGVKVGPAPTRAAHRVPGVPDVAELLGILLHHRRSALDAADRGEAHTC